MMADVEAETCTGCST